MGMSKDEIRYSEVFAEVLVSLMSTELSIRCRSAQRWVRVKGWRQSQGLALLSAQQPGGSSLTWHTELAAVVNQGNPKRT